MPSATDRDFLDLRVSDVRRVGHSGQDHHVVLFQESESGRRLPIWIGHEHALELALRLLGHDSHHLSTSTPPPDDQRKRATTWAY